MAHSSQTEIKVENVTHSRTVKNFSHCYQEYLENFVHLTRGDEQHTWSIKIYPKGNGENNKDFVFLCLNRIINTGKSSKIGFKSRFTLRSAENKDIEMRIHPNPSHSDYVSYIKRDVLFPQILPRDLIVVQVEIDVAVETITTNTEQHSVVNMEQQLFDDYLKIFRDELLTDFVIKVSGREVRAHRAILAARSPVFCAMLTHDQTNEAKTAILEIPDLEYDVVVEMLNYIYCGRCSKDINHIASDLLIAADKYRLDELKTHCEKTLVEQIQIDNACEMLILGDMYGAKWLRKRAVQYILHRPKQITSTIGWEAVLRQHPQLVTDIVNQFDKGTSVTTIDSVPPSC